MFIYSIYLILLIMLALLLTGQQDGSFGIPKPQHSFARNNDTTAKPAEASASSRCFFSGFT
jgi:hypothetical protein